MDLLSVGELVEFSADKRIRKKLVASDRIIAELVCYEPGQGTPLHYHPKQDEVFYVLDGNGTISVGEEESEIGPKSIILVPAQTRHGFAAASDSRLVIMFFKAPASSSSAPA